MTCVMKKKFSLFLHLLSSDRKGRIKLSDCSENQPHIYSSDAQTPGQTAQIGAIDSQLPGDIRPLATVPDQRFADQGSLKRIHGLFQHLALAARRQYRVGRRRDG